MPDLYYKPSGKFNLSGVALGLVGGFIVGLLLAYVYSYIISYIPFIYLNFLVTIGYGMALGAVIGLFMLWGNVRNRWVAASVALFVAFTSLYFSWAVWLSVLFAKADIKFGALEIAQQPGFLWETIKKLNETGVWSIGSLRARQSVPISGVILWLVWAAEALIVLGVPVIAAVGAMSTEPFCEACQSWCRQTKELMLVKDLDSGELKRRIAAQDFDYFKSLEPKKAGQLDWSRIEIYECPQCGQTNTVSLIRERLTTNENGKTSTEGTTVVDKLLVSKSDVDRLRQVSQEFGRVQEQKESG